MGGARDFGRRRMGIQLQRDAFFARVFFSLPFVSTKAQHSHANFLIELKNVGIPCQMRDDNQSSFGRIN